MALLFDPGADGIHRFEVVSATDDEVLQADNPAQCGALTQLLKERSDDHAPQVRSYRGLGSIAPAVLRQRCLDPATRFCYAIGANEIKAVRAVFGGDSPD